MKKFDVRTAIADIRAKAKGGIAFARSKVQGWFPMAREVAMLLALIAGGTFVSAAFYTFTTHRMSNFLGFDKPSRTEVETARDFAEAERIRTEAIAQGVERIRRELGEACGTITTLPTKKQ